MTGRPEDFYEIRRFAPETPERLIALVNGRMLFNKHLGFRRDICELRSEGDEKFLAAEKLFLEIFYEAFSQNLLKPQGLLGFFEADSQGETLRLYGRGGQAAAEFTFPRLAGTENIQCLPDLVPRKDSGARKSVALFVCTAGPGCIERANELSQSGEYVKSHMLNIAAMTAAEAMAEAAQEFAQSGTAFSRSGGGIPALPPQTAGRRFSFGYPLCPDLDGQKTIFSLLKPERIGVSLTETMMMYPEASVSGMIFI
ncbi:MAG: vitamin B12 dependent-methionine synthase activation domain-containing protein [Elusimicrobiaceae bacterium]|jgi:5-methyltetrahydrofolate--homocysteine methyltransferase